MSFFSKVFGGLGKAVSSVVGSILGIKSQVSVPPPPPVKVEIPTPPPTPSPAHGDVKQQSEAKPASYSDSSSRSSTRRKPRKSLMIRGIGIPGTE